METHRRRKLNTSHSMFHKLPVGRRFRQTGPSKRQEGTSVSFRELTKLEMKPANLEGSSAFSCCSVKLWLAQNLQLSCPPHTGASGNGRMAVTAGPYGLCNSTRRLKPSLS
ncbi:hypothetical protein BaRGS_00029739 [Batillaria attramentaria]|uniref:Uncharacterized protein n=1 Tax=Batillaria attramentaria TaxID=370345 RepID=A0ABD0JWM5_9CAEN